MAKPVENIRTNVYINEKEAGKSLRSLEAKARKLNNELKGMSRNSEKFGAKKAEFQKINREVQKQRRELRGLNKGWSNAAFQFNKYYGIVLAGVAAMGGLVFSFRELVRAFSDFEAGLTNVYTLLDEETFDRYHAELERGAKEVMKEYGFAQKDVNKALFDAISAGVPAGKAIEFLHESATLAVGGVTRLSVSTDGLTSILNAYKLEITETKNVADAFFSAQKEGKTTVELLSSTIGKAAPIASNLGISYQELLAGIATLTKGGISTAEAVTYLRGAMVALQKPTTKTTQLFEQEFGHGLGVSEIKARGFGTIIDELNQLMGKYPDEIAAAIPNIRAFTGITALSGKGLEEYNRILQLVNNDIGENSSLTQAYNRQQETSAQYLARARAELDTYRIALGEKLQPIMGMLVFRMSKLVKLLVELPKWWKENKEFVALFAGVLLLYNQQLLLATARKWKLLAAERAHIAQQKLNVIWTEAQITAQALYITGNMLLTRKIGLATAGQRAFNIVLASNPIGLVITSVMLLVGALKLYDTYSERSVKMAKQEKAIKGELAKANEEVKKTEEELTVLMKGYQKASEQERKEIRKLIEHKQAELSSRLANIKAKRDEIALTATELTASQKLWYGLKGVFTGTLSAAQDAAVRMAKNGKEATAEYDESILTLENDLKELEQRLVQLDATDEEIAQEKARRAEQWAEERSSAERKIQEFLNNLNDDELAAAKRKFTELTELAEKYGIDRKELEKATQAELRRIKYENIEKEALAEQERKLQLMENSMQQLWEYEQGKLIETAEFRELTQEEQQARLLELELQHLQRVLEARQSLGEDTFAIEKKITDLKAQQTESRIKLNEQEEQSLKRSAAASAFNAAANARNAEEAKSAVLNSIRAQIQAYLAKAIAGAIAEEFATKGLLGAITGGLAAGAVGVLFNTLVPSFNTGGFTGLGLGADANVPGRRIAGVVHDNEYVVATEELRHPNIAPLVQMIEAQRRRRMGGGSFETGGPTSAGSSQVINNTTTQTIDVSDLVQVTNQLAIELQMLRENGVQALIGDRDIRQLKKLQKEFEQIEKNA